MPRVELESPFKPGPLWTFQNYYWVLDQEGNALFYKTVDHPLANVNESLATRIFRGSVPEPIQVILIPWAFTKFKMSDYYY